MLVNFHGITCSLAQMVICSQVSGKEVGHNEVVILCLNSGSLGHMQGGSATSSIGVGSGSRQIEWLSPQNDELVIFCHLAEHLPISSPYHMSSLTSADSQRRLFTISAQTSLKQPPIKCAQCPVLDPHMEAGPLQTAFLEGDFEQLSQFVVRLAAL